MCNSTTVYCGFCISDLEADKISEQVRQHSTPSTHSSAFVIYYNVLESDDKKKYDTEDSSQNSVIPCTPSPKSLLTPPKSTNAPRTIGKKCQTKKTPQLPCCHHIPMLVHNPSGDVEVA